ncbi:MAG: hypothetical protein PHO70_00055 [Candidatus Omnitrophica bacterium]|nr:hypothetical protein [Candidatus Omnitrophota bacterium]
MIKMNKKGIALIISFFVILVLSIIGSVAISRSISEGRVASKHLESAQAFWLAEAAMTQGVRQLALNYNFNGASARTRMVANNDIAGGYFFEIAPDVTVPTDRVITAHGIIPFVAAGTPRTERIIQVTARRSIPADFYDNAIYSAGDITLNGNAYNINGNVRYAGSITSPSNITGTHTQDPAISPLAMLDFQQLLTISQSQNNVYAYVGNKLKNTVSGSQNLPTSFWFSPGVPNVVYIMGDLSINPSGGTVGGFIVVAGDVINDLTATQDTTLNGNGTVDGCIYTRGEFRVNGGGGGNLNVNGGVWAGELGARVNGSVNIGYNQTYMDALAGLNINPGVQVISWRDLQNP